MRSGFSLHLADLLHGHLQEPESLCVPAASKQPRRLDRPDEGSVGREVTAPLLGGEAERSPPPRGIACV